MYGAGAKLAWTAGAVSCGAYETRGVAYMNAMKEFVAGYKEGIERAAEPMQPEEDEEVGAANRQSLRPRPTGWHLRASPVESEARSR